MRWLLLAAVAIGSNLATRGAVEAQERVTVGSKKFTESVVLGEILTLLARSEGAESIHRRELGGTAILWDGLVGGAIDLYPEYTGTLREQIFAGKSVESEAELERLLAERGLVMTKPLGFNNTYAIGLKKERATALGLERISELRNHPGLRVGFTNEFLDRKDGWPGLRDRYDLGQLEVMGLDHDLAYVGLENGSIDVMDLYSTDAEIDHYDLAVLEDDLGYFPRYDAVVLYRRDLEERCPRVVEALRRLEGAISEKRIIGLNKRAKIDRVEERVVAADFLREDFRIESEVSLLSRSQRLFLRTGEHLLLVGLALAAGIVVAVPLGVLAAKRPRTGAGILGGVGVLQTIPALALLVLIMQLLQWIDLPGVDSLGNEPAILALFCYSLLPIVRNTYAGLHDISPDLIESAEALGLSPWERLRHVELPLAARSILAGVKTSAVMSIGFATLGALIGAGGYGRPILTGLRLNDTALILEGAVPAAALALAVQGAFDLAERRIVPAGLRIRL